MQFIEGNLVNSKQTHTAMNDLRQANGQYLKGRKQTPEEKLNCIAGLRKSWRDRKDYLGEIKNSPLFNCYRAFRFTLKGKKIGCSESWKSYKNFYSDMHSTYKRGCRLARLDKSKPFSFDNCRWLTEEEAALVKDNSVKLTYNGETKTLREWSIQYEANYNGVRQRYHRGKNYSAHEIIFGRIKKPRPTITDIKLLGLQRKRDKVSKMVSAYRCKDKKKGLHFNLSNDWFWNNIITKPCTYCGTTENVGCDRIDNSKGHTTENVIPACYTCNTIRNNLFTVEEMKIVGKTVAEVLERRKLKVA